MKLLSENLNPIAFLGGLALLGYGLWEISPAATYITVGAVLMAAVCVDAGLRIAIKLKGQK